MREGWDLVKLGSLCDIQNGFAFDSKLFNNDGKGLPLIRIRDIKRGYSETFTTEECDNAYVVKDGDYLIGMDGEFNIGQWKSENALLNQRVCKLLPSSKILPRFIYYYIPKALKDIEDKTAYATVKHLSSKQIKEIHIPNISLPEQQRIVDILDREFAKIDALKANAEKSLQAVKDLFQAMLLKELEEVPGVRQVELNEITEICLGLTHTPKYVEKGVPFVSVKDISGGKLDLSTTKRISEKEFRDFPYGAKPQKGDVLFCRVGTIGKPMILEEDTPFGIFVSVGFFRPYKERVLNSFLKYWMLSSIFERQVEINVVGSTLKNLNTGWLKHFSVPLPPLEQQRRLVDRLDILYRKNCTLQDNYQKTLTLCDDLKQSLLRKAFNGEL